MLRNLLTAFLISRRRTYDEGLAALAVAYGPDRDHGRSHPPLHVPVHVARLVLSRVFVVAPPAIRHRNRKGMMTTASFTMTTSAMTICPDCSGGAAVVVRGTNRAVVCTTCSPTNLPRASWKRPP